MSNLLPGTKQIRRPVRKIVLLLILLLALLGAGAGAYYWWSNTHAKPQYITAEVTQGDIERSVSVTGSINPRTTVQVGSYVSGTIQSLSCDFNTQVKAGQICAKIDPSTFQVAVDQAAAQLNSSKAQLHKDEAAMIYAKGVYDRDAKLLGDGIVAQEVADNDKNLYKQALSQIELDKATIVAQEASLKSAVVNLNYTNIVSPVNGTVLTRNVDVGQTVASSLQTPTLFLIGKDMTKMQVDANVSEADVGRIRENQGVSFSVQAYPDKTFEGTVKQIRRGPITVQNVVTYDVVVSVDNPELLLFPGMTADAEIVTDSHENVVRIPLAATRFTPERKGRSDGTRAKGESRDDDKAENRSGRSGRSGDKSTSSRVEKNGEKKHADKADKADQVEDATNNASSASVASAASASSSNNQNGTDEAHHSHHDGSDKNHWQHHGEHADNQQADANRDHYGWGNGEHHREHRGEGESKDKQKTDEPASAQKNDDDNTSVKDSAQADTIHSSGKPETEAAKRARIWVLRDGKPHPVWITTGLDDGELIEVLSGELKPGDKVIIGEVRPVEPKSTPIQSPFNQGGGRRGGMGRP